MEMIFFKWFLIVGSCIGITLVVWAAMPKVPTGVFIIGASWGFIYMIMLFVFSIKVAALVQIPVMCITFLLRKPLCKLLKI